MQRWEKVKKLYEEGTSIRQISKEMDMSRNTVRKWIRSDEKPKYTRKHYSTKVDKYKNQIRKWHLENHYVGTKIYKELKKIGYDGSISPIYRYLNKIREEI